MDFLAVYQQQIALLRKNAVVHLQTLGADVKPLYILKSLIDPKACQIVTGLDATEVLVRTLDIPFQSKRKIRSVLPFQVETLLPYPKEDLLLFPTLYSKKEKQTEVILVAATKTSVKNHLNRLAASEIDPDVVSCSPTALFRFARHYCPDTLSLCIHHLSHTQSLFIVISEGRLQSAHVQNCEDTTAVEAHLLRMTAYVQKKHPEIRDLLLTGKANDLPSYYNPLKVDPNVKEFAIPIGLALDAAINDHQSIQMRQRELLPEKVVKQRKRRVMQFFAVCSVFGFLLLFMSHMHVKNQENALLENSDYEGLSLRQAIEVIEADLQGQKKISIPLPPHPNLSEFLNWLSIHPLLSSGCSIQELHYTRSTDGTKVDLQLIAQNPKSANAFHEALLKERLWVDQKKGVTWEGDHGLYRINFFLRQSK